MLRKTRTILFFVAATLVIYGYALSRPFIDFGQYWSAGHLLLAHKTPYSLAEIYQAEIKLGWNELVPDAFLSPPWVLAVVAPLGLMNSYFLAWTIWVAILASFVALSSYLLMDVYFGSTTIAEISDTTFNRCLFAFTFYPVLLSLKFAQLSPILLLGISGFLYYERRRPMLAGLFLSLTLMKPHLLYLIWIAVAFASFQKRQTKTLITAMAALGVFTAIGLSLDHHAFREYWELMSGPYPQIVFSGILGIVRRILDGHDTYWLQAIPPLFGVAWFALYWRNHKNDWDWAERLPALVTISVMTTAYGWVHDQTLLMVPIIGLAAEYSRALGHLPRGMVIIYTALNVCLIFSAIISTQAAFIPAPILIGVLLLRHVPPPTSECQLELRTTS